jgi:hypothetical protein
MEKTNNNDDLLAELKAIDTQGRFPERLITTAHGGAYKTNPAAERQSLQRLLAAQRAAEQENF